MGVPEIQGAIKYHKPFNPITSIRSMFAWTRLMSFNLAMIHNVENRNYKQKGSQAEKKDVLRCNKQDRLQWKTML